MKPSTPVFIALAAIVAGCGPMTRKADVPGQDAARVPMPSGITCDRNAAGYPENCNVR